MKNLLSLIIVFLFSFNSIYAQNATSHQIAKHAIEFETINSVKPFVKTKSPRQKTHTGIKGKVKWLDIEPDFCKTINQKSKSSDVLKLNLPSLGANSIEVKLKKIDLLTDDFILEVSSGKQQFTKEDFGVYYRGVVEGMPNSLVVFNVQKDEVSAVVDLGDKTLTIGKALDSENYIMYDEAGIQEIPEFSCFAEEISYMAETQIDNNLNKSNPDPNNCVRMYFEIDNDVYTHFGSVSSTFNFITGAFSQVALLYANEAINIKLNQILIWDTADPYTGPSSLSYITQFNSAMSNSSFNGDLAHLIGFDGNGGFGYVDKLCENYQRTAYSSIYTTYNQVPAYSWTVNVIAHEIGHNLGSPHTHQCVWNGNNTQIDDCGAQSGSSCYDPNNPIIPQNGGTIMSYCHFNTVGIDLNLGFGTQPGNLIRNRVYNAACLTACTPCPTFGNLCDDGDPCTIADRIDSYCQCSGVLQADEDQDGVCATLDPDDTNPCVPQSVIGQSCDDGSPCTENDIYDANCNCVGTFVDSDNDTVCDAYDRCPGFDDFLDTNFNEIPDDCECAIGDPCDDGDICTDGDVYDNFCNCIGTLTADTDGDGICDTLDQCNGSPDPGNPCDDGDACTTNDSIDDFCNCVGTYVDTDNDSVCDGNDVCPGGDDTIDSDNDGIPDFCDYCDGNIAGTDCDDGDALTINDVYDSNCVCSGVDFCSDISTAGISLSSPNGSLNCTNINFAALNYNISFAITGIESVLSGNPNNRYIDRVTVQYVDANGLTQTHQVLTSNGTILIPGPASGLILCIEDSDGNPGVGLTATVSSISSCEEIDICPQNIDLSSTVSQGLYQAGTEVNCSAPLNAGEQIQFKAGTIISLEAGTIIPTNTDFEATIEGCDN